MSIRKSSLLLAALAAVLALQAGAQSKPNFTGSWKLNETLTPAGGPRDIVFKIEHSDPHFKYTASGKSGMQSFTETQEFTTDGKMPADPTKVLVMATWEGPALVMHYCRAGKEIVTFTYRISADGKQMTRDGESPRKFHEVYDRQ